MFPLYHLSSFKDIISYKDGTVVRALAFHHCTSGLIPGPGVTHGLSLLLALILALKVFLQVLWFSTLRKPTLQIPIQSGNSRQKEPPFGMSIAKSQSSISYYIGIINKLKT